MEIKRKPYRVVFLTKENCDDLDRAMKTIRMVLDQETEKMAGLSGPTPTAHRNDLRHARNAMAALLPAVIDID